MPILISAPENEGIRSRKNKVSALYFNVAEK
jgi:hypothetical protein